MRLKELRILIRNLLKEDMTTIPARKSPAEKEFSSELPSWGKQQNKELKRQTPVQVKAKQVSDLLKKKGRDNTASGAKIITQQLIPFLEKIDPQDLFVMDASEIAQEFENKFFN